MSNEIERIAETVGKDIIHGVEYPFVHTAQFIAVIDTAVKNSPAVKAAIIDLVKQAEIVISDTGKDIAAKGIDITEDVQTLTDAKAFFVYFESVFIPLVETIYKEIVSDNKLMAVGQS